MINNKDGRTRKPHHYSLGPDVEDYLAWVKYKIGMYPSREIDRIVRDHPDYQKWLENEGSRWKKGRD